MLLNSSVLTKLLSNTEYDFYFIFNHVFLSWNEMLILGINHLLIKHLIPYL